MGVWWSRGVGRERDDESDERLAGHVGWAMVGDELDGFAGTARQRSVWKGAQYRTPVENAPERIGTHPSTVQTPSFLKIFCWAEDMLNMMLDERNLISDKTVDGM